jgi:hypothetical protein
MAGVSRCLAVQQRGCSSARMGAARARRTEIWYRKGNCKLVSKHPSATIIQPQAGAATSARSGARPTGSEARLPADKEREREADRERERETDRDRQRERERRREIERGAHIGTHTHTHTHRHAHTSSAARLTPPAQTTARAPGGAACRRGRGGTGWKLVRACKASAISTAKSGACRA